MSIVLNEKEWVLEKLEQPSLGKKPSETLSRIVKYYSSEGFSKTETRKKLETFLLQSDSTVSIPKWTKSIERVIKLSFGEPLINIDYISITESELSIISGLKGEQLKRLAFTLLCLAKYQKLVNPINDYWVNTKESEIMKLSNISTSLKRRCLMFKELQDLGLIQFSKRVDNTNVRVCFADDGSPMLKISDFRNLGYQYMMYRGKPYFVCANCGITSKYANPNIGRKQRYCKKCSSEIAIRQRIDSAMNYKLKKLK